MEFTSDELKAVILLGLVAGFIVAFDDVVSTTGFIIHVSLDPGLIIMLLTCIGMVVSVFIHEAAHKLVARGMGYYTHIEGYYPGQIIGIVIAIFTFGLVQFYTPNTADLEASPQARMHKHRKYENPKQQAIIAASGILATGLFATFLHGAFIFSGEPTVLRNIIIGNVWLMIYSLIPFELLSFYFLRFMHTIQQIPESDGLYLLHYSVTAYVTAATFALMLGLILVFTTAVSAWLAVFVALVTGLIVWMRFFMEA
jgi:hypothetical protein